MTFKTFFKTCLMTAVLGSFVLSGASCTKPAGTETTGGTITGTVTDTNDNPVEGVKVSASNVSNAATTAADGTYTLTGVTVSTISVSFSKEGYQSTSVTVPASRFDANGNATVNATLTVANAKITGTVLDGANGNVPLSGATVTLNDAASTSATTGSDGKFTFENLTVRDYVVTYTMEGYLTATVNLTSGDFDNDQNTATADATLYTNQLLPGLTLTELKAADKWYYNEYRGGTGGTEYPRWDWSTAFMGSLNFYGIHDEIGEGTDLVVGESNYATADLNNYASYMWGSKLITDDNYIMTVRSRTFSDRDGASIWSVSVIDLSEAEPTLVKIGDNITSNNLNGDYEDNHFDLSAYKGKEIIIALGIYCSEANQGKHLAIKRINFTSTRMSGWDWIAGTDVPGLEGWHMTQEMVRSTMPNEKTLFSGITNYSDTGNRCAAYQSWRENDHIAWQWGFMALTKDTEIFAGQGALIKTRGGNSYEINTKVPESYFYSKFTIGAGNDNITLKMRTFGSNYTFFKLTAITADGLEVAHLSPSSYECHTPDGGQGECSAAEDGCWKFKNDCGEPTEVDKYASFTYDLSAYNGKDVVLVLGVYKGEANGDENKICIYSVALN